jgi:hypothetical protein
MVRLLTTVSVVLMLDGCASHGSATAPAPTPECAPPILLSDPLSPVEIHYKTDIAHAAGPKCTEPKKEASAEIRAEGNRICNMPPGPNRDRRLKGFKNRHRIRNAICVDGPETRI